MPTWALILIVLVVVAVAAVVITATARQRRTKALRGRFGPEYDRTLEAREDQRAAESELRNRQRQRAGIDIKPLPEASRLRYSEEWRVVQEHFVDQPAESVGSADSLLHQVMAERGYPMGDFAAQSDLVSVDHPEVVENYRVAHATRDRLDTGQVSTEELRDALLRYRSLFDEMLRADQGDTAKNGTTSTADVTDGADATDRTDVTYGTDVTDRTGVTDGTDATNRTGVTAGAGLPRMTRVTGGDDASRDDIASGEPDLDDSETVVVPRAADRQSSADDTGGRR